MVEVTRTYLELRDPSRLNRKPLPSPGATFVRQAHCSAAQYRELYRRVGDRWHWRDRQKWTDEKLADYLARPSIAIWELHIAEELGGYFELETQPNDDVEIVYFGLVPEFIGRGYGGALLTKAVDEAFAMGARRVWVNTCTLDAPQALPNYKARGFTETGRVEKYVVQL